MMVSRQDESAPQRSAIAQLLFNVHGSAILDHGGSARKTRSQRRLSLDSCRHAEGKTRVYVRNRDHVTEEPFVKVDNLRN